MRPGHSTGDAISRKTRRASVSGIPEIEYNLVWSVQSH